MIRSTALVLLMLAAVGCGKNGGGSSNDWKAEAMAAPPMTKELFNRLASMNEDGLIPDKSLLLNDFENVSERRTAENDLNAEGRKVLERAKRDCSISPERETEFGDAVVGETSGSTTTASIAGAKCPISFKKSQTTQIRWDSMDMVNNGRDLAVTGRFNYKISSKLEVVDPKLKHRAAQSSLQYSFNFDGPMSGTTNLKTKASTYFGTMTGGGNVTAVLKGGVVVYGELKLRATMNGSADKLDFEVLAKLPFPEGTIVAYIQSNNGVTTMYINGQELNEANAEAFVKKFGGTVPR